MIFLIIFDDTMLGNLSCSKLLEQTLSLTNWAIITISSTSSQGLREKSLFEVLYYPCLDIYGRSSILKMHLRVPSDKASFSLSYEAIPERF